MNILVLRIFHTYVLVTDVLHVWLYFILTKQSGNIEQYPGPKSNSCQSFSTCHWSLNSISAHNFIKTSLLKTYIATRRLDVICLSENYPVFQTMMTIWKLLVMIYSEQTTRLILNEAVFVFIVETLFP